MSGAGFSPHELDHVKIQRFLKGVISLFADVLGPRRGGKLMKSKGLV